MRNCSIGQNEKHLLNDVSIWAVEHGPSYGSSVMFFVLTIETVWQKFQTGHFMRVKDARGPLSTNGFKPKLKVNRLAGSFEIVSGRIDYYNHGHGIPQHKTIATN